MHMGRHTDSTSTTGDALRFRQVSAFVLDSQGDASIPGIVPGPGSSLEFWHMISIPDDENFGSGFVPPGTAFGGGQVQVSLLGLDGNFERWKRLGASFNGYDGADQDTVSLCGFDPGDDENPPANETLCNSGAPLFNDKGDMYGSDPTCTVDNDGNDPAHLDCGDISCVPGAGCTETGPGASHSGTAGIGTGVWNRSAFDLSSFAGRVARLRWIGMMEGGWSFGTSRSSMEPSAGPAYQMFDDDAGWYIDDIVVTDLRALPAIIGPDTVIGQSTCLAHTPLVNNDNCGVMNASIAGSSPLEVDTLLQNVVLDGRQSFAADDPGTGGVVEGACTNGVLEYQWSKSSGGSGGPYSVMQAYSPDGTLVDSPDQDSYYLLEVRCSADVTCTDTAIVQALVYPGDGSDLNPTASRGGGVGLVVTGGALATISWPTGPQAPGVNGYDVYSYSAGPGTGDASITGTWSGGTQFHTDACVMFAVAGSADDASIPVPGEAFFYQVGHHVDGKFAATAFHNSPLGQRPASSAAAGLAGVQVFADSCP
jgi:hypothetical protein